ncbi:molybdopterin-dependent oxidoreductase [Niveibacterium sp. SC-1]|uniref:molybdopterin-dependent oxidoreductase n=1 Tax=Niveibacterium sp. SC-1 TaxID=3135646 RepID=UPI00311FE48C
MRPVFAGGSGRTRREYLGALAALAFATVSGLAAAADAEAPKPGRVVLSVAREDGAGKPVRFDMAALQKLERKTIVSALPPSMKVQGQHEWVGVPIRAVLAAAGVKPGVTIKVSALNAYSASIPAEDLERYEPILAYLRDGKPMSIRDKGPLFVIYPFDQHAELQQMEFVNRAVWQANEIFVR